MKVRMAVTAAGPDGNLVSGEVYDVPDGLAERWIAAGAAVSVEVAESVEPEPEPVVETAVEHVEPEIPEDRAPRQKAKSNRLKKGKR